MTDDENNKSNIAIEKEEEKRNDKKANDIRSRLRKNPNKTKPLYVEEYHDKKYKGKENEIPPSEKEVCRKILETLKSDNKSILFRQPAIKLFTEKEDKDSYKQQIKEPRDLGNITKKLKSTKYTAKEFHDDLELCWSNALLFNNNDTDAYKDAEYLKDLSDKLYKEYGLFNFINNDIEKEKGKEKELEKNKEEIKDSEGNNNSVQSEENKIINNEPKIENTESNNNIINNDNENNNNETNVEKNNTSNKSNKIIGKKRKRNDDLGELLENIKEKKTERRREIKTFNFNDITNKFIIRHPLITNPFQIPKLVRKNFTKRKKRLTKVDKNICIKKEKEKENHIHHCKLKHLFYIHKDRRPEFNEKEYQRKINFEWVELLHLNNGLNKNICKEEKEEIEIDISFSAKDDSQNNKYKENIDSNSNKYNNDIIKLNENLNKNNISLTQKEKAQMSKFDINYNTENVYDLESKKDLSKTGIKEMNKSNNLNNQYNLYNIGNIKTNMNEHNYTNQRNNKKNDKNFGLRSEIAKYFDQLSDSLMIELLVYIENIRPQAIKELANDTIYINMELFNDETFTKVLEFVKKYV